VGCVWGSLLSMVEGWGSPCVYSGPGPWCQFWLICCGSFKI
jgi:hypothetical protein